MTLFHADARDPLNFEACLADEFDAICRGGAHFALSEASLERRIGRYLTCLLPLCFVSRAALADEFGAI